MHFVFCHQPSLALKFIISYILKLKEFIHVHTYVYDSCTYMGMHMHTQMCICVNIYDSHGEIPITLPMKVIFFLPKTTPSYFYDLTDHAIWSFFFDNDLCCYLEFCSCQRIQNLTPCIIVFSLFRIMWNFTVLDKSYVGFSNSSAYYSNWL